MKKLDNKGFTLVELLAVIIILAIVVGISIPAVMTTVNNAKKSAGQSAARSAADWFDRQYQAAQTGFDVSGGSVTVDSNFKSLCGNTGSSCVGTTKTATTATISAAGLLPDNIQTMTVKINTNGRSCVKLTVIKGDYFNTAGTGTQTYSGGVC